MLVQKLDQKLDLDLSFLRTPFLLNSFINISKNLDNFEKENCFFTLIFNIIPNFLNIAIWESTFN